MLWRGKGKAEKTGKQNCLQAKWGQTALFWSVRGAFLCPVVVGKLAEYLPLYWRKGKF